MSSTVPVSLKTNQGCLQDDRKPRDPSRRGLQLRRWSWSGETATRHFQHSQRKDKEKASKELRDVKASLEKTQKEVKSEKQELAGAISKQKMQAAKELNDVKVVVEKSQEQAKVSLLEGLIITWIFLFKWESPLS